MEKRTYIHDCIGDPPWPGRRERSPISREAALCRDERQKALRDRAGRQGRRLLHRHPPLSRELRAEEGGRGDGARLIPVESGQGDVAEPLDNLRVEQPERRRVRLDVAVHRNFDDLRRFC